MRLQTDEETKTIKVGGNPLGGNEEKTSLEKSAIGYISVRKDLGCK